MFDIKAVEPQFGRVKGASWFPLLYRKDVMVLGQGGIGSWTSLMLSRIGCTLHIFDMDSYEAHNMTGQVVKKSAIGKNKARAMVEIISEFSTSMVYDYNERYTEDSFASDIMICGFDNMVARKLAFNNWKKNLANIPQGERHMAFFQDGRLLAEQLQIFNLTGDCEPDIEEYEKKWLFDDAEVEEAECTFKQTSHCAAMIASHMVGFLTNWASNSDAINKGVPVVRNVPFMYEYLIPLNLVT
jgi:molybdopterin/thiamine biosynthesis adenylyltransferase